MVTPGARYVVTDLPERIDRQRLLTIRATFDEHVKAGRTHHVLNLDKISVWQDEASRSIILISRTLRSVGGRLRLVTTHQDMRSALSRTGLDKVLRVYADEEAAAGAIDENITKPGSPDHSSRTSSTTEIPALMMTSIRLLIGLLLLLLVISAGASGASAPQAGASPDTMRATNPQDIVQHLIGRDPDLQSYRAHVHVKIRMRSFPFLAPALDGAVYFKRPGKYEVILNRVPFYARGFDHIYADIGDPSNWDQRFYVSYSGQTAVGDHTDIVLKLVQRVRGMIDHQLVMGDPGTWRIDKVEWHYYNGGVIEMSQQYSEENGFDIVSRQSVDIKIPHISAIGQAALTDYETNVAIDDATFSMKNHR